MSLYKACSDGTCCRVGCATCRRRREQKNKTFDAMAWGDRISDEQLDELLARAEGSQSVKLRIDQFRDLVRQAKATRPEARRNEIIEECAKRCEESGFQWAGNYAGLIRALKETPSPQAEKKT